MQHFQYLKDMSDCAFSSNVLQCLAIIASVILVDIKEKLMKKPTFLSSNIISIVLLACMFLSSCGAAPAPGQVVAVRSGAVDIGIKAVLSGTVAGVKILVSGDSYIFIWPLGDGWAFYGYRLASVDKTVLCSPIGNLICSSDMSNLVETLLNKGWTSISATKIPESIKIALGQGAGNIITFLAIPFSSIENMQKYAPEERKN